MKVFILTEAGKGLGLGHLTRCISLYQAFRKIGVSPHFIIDGDASIKDFLKDKQHSIFKWLANRKKTYDLMEGSDAVIIDSYLADPEFYKKASGLTKKFICIDDNKRLDYPRGLIVNGSVFAEQHRYPKRDNLAYLLGTKYIALRAEFWNVPVKNIKRDLTNILVTFGGIDRSAFVRGLMRHITEKFNFNFISVNHADMRDARGMCNLMLKSDLCISGGGQTTYELARCGVPTIGICFADNQLMNLEGWSKAGFLDFLGRYDREDLFKKLDSSLVSMLDYRKRLKMSRIGQRFVDGRGAERVAREILER